MTRRRDDAPDRERSRSSALERRRARAPRRVVLRARVGDDDGASASASVSDEQLGAAGFNVDALASPQDRAIAIKAYNDSRNAMAAAHEGQTLNAISSGVGVAVVALSFAPPPWSAAGPLLGAFWAGALGALKALERIFGTARSGLGVWTEWCNATPPIDENDPNWWHAETGYAAAVAMHGRGADTPWTHGRETGSGIGYDWPHEPEAHGFGDMNARIESVDPRALAFARFAMPLLYRAFELEMNCRVRDKDGYAVRPDTDAETFAKILALYNSQHAGPAAGIQNVAQSGAQIGAHDVFPFAPAWFTLNVGPMLGAVAPLGVNLRASRTQQRAPVDGLFVSTSTADVAARALRDLASWIAYYEAKRGR